MTRLLCLLSCLSLALAASQLEIQALTDLYNSCNGPNWTNKQNWESRSDPCGPLPWAGISCDGSPQQYINIVKLYDNNLKGQIPISIINLISLTVLDLSFNAINGTIPEGLYSMHTLKQLQLNINNITGTISSSIGNLQALTILDLGQNTMHGSIPASLYTILPLRQVELTGNQLSGTISNSVGNLQNLEIFLVGSNKLTGSIPSSFGTIPSLNMLQFTTNIITGTIPPSLCSLHNMTGLWLDNNKVNGGGLTGSIPSCFGSLYSLVNLFLSGNKLTGGVPSELGNLNNLQQLFVGDNSLGGTIPSQLGNIGANLTHLDISQASMTGSIPASLGTLTSLQYLNLATNQLTGTIPNSLANLGNLQQLQLQATYGSTSTLTGTVPEGIFSLQQLNLLMLANNKFTGGLPPSFSLENLQQLDLTGTQLTGTIPEALYANSGLTLLFLANNKFQGSLELIEALTNIKQLTLNNNQLSGFVPNFFANTSYGNPPRTVLAGNPFLCPLPSWAHTYTGASCTDWAISSLSPPYGDTISNTLVTVNGTQFQNLFGLNCNFGDIAAPATYISGTQLQCTAPPTQNISRVLNFTLSYQAKNFGLTSTPTFVYLGVPEIASIIPNTGRQQGFDKVTVTGANFFSFPKLNLVSCMFGDMFVPAVSVQPTQVICTTPPSVSLGDVPISVSIDGNQTIGNDNIMFTYFEYCDGMPEPCTGNGVCNTLISPPVCICNTNFVGNVCGKCDDTYFGPQCLECPNCGANGTCNSTITGDGLCICDVGFYGTRCVGCPACAHGRCEDGQGGSGKCHCDTLWGGELCDSRWELYVIVAVPGSIVVMVVIIVGVKCRANKREYKRLSRFPPSEPTSQTN